MADERKPPLSLGEVKTLLQLGLGVSEPMRMPIGTVFGDYELCEEIGAGSSGVVYRAIHAGTHRTVALKLMCGAALAKPQDIERFLRGAEAAAALKHPNIVAVYHVGEREGQPFFTMRPLEGGNLKDALPRISESRERAAAMLAKVARAVHHAHVHGVLHRDLKPANILLDEHDEPYVADFGLAKRLDDSATASLSSEIVGTPDYMAPEQTRGGRITPAADVYSLGVILYELLTGECPLPEGSLVDRLAWLTSPEPAPSPRELNRAIPKNFETICLRCLEKDPSARYQSAEELAAALERASQPGGADEPSRPLLRRLLAWRRRRPARALACLLLCPLAALTWWAWRVEQRAVQDTLETNAFIAGSQAGAALLQFREYSERVVEAAKNPEVILMLERGEVVSVAPALQPLARSFDSLAVLSEDARVIARWPTSTRSDGRTYEFRDYVRGARVLAAEQLPGAYLARSFRAEPGGNLTFAFSCPVRNAANAPIGIVLGSLSAKSVLGPLRMHDGSDGRHIISALVGPRGLDRGAAAGVAPPLDFTFLAHPGLVKGHEHTLRSPKPATLRAAFGASAPAGRQFAFQYLPPVKDAHYADPVPGFEGEWLAAFAPVGRTGFIMLVQTRRRSAWRWLHDFATLR